MGEEERRSYLNGRFFEFCAEMRGLAGERGGWNARVWAYLRSGAEEALDRARQTDPQEWAYVDSGWRFLLSLKSDDELLATPGIGRGRLRAIRGIAPRPSWAVYWSPDPDAEPHRDRLRPPPPKGRHPWWLLP